VWVFGRFKFRDYIIQLLLHGLDRWFGHLSDFGCFLSSFIFRCITWLRSAIKSANFFESVSLSIRLHSSNMCSRSSGFIGCREIVARLRCLHERIERSTSQTWAGRAVTGTSLPRYEVSMRVSANSTKGRANNHLHGILQHTAISVGSGE
jgi:hypothetical protein